MEGMIIKVLEALWRLLTWLNSKILMARVSRAIKNSEFDGQVSVEFSEPDWTCKFIPIYEEAMEKFRKSGVKYVIMLALNKFEKANVFKLSKEDDNEKSMNIANFAQMYAYLYNAYNDTEIEPSDAIDKLGLRNLYEQAYKAEMSRPISF